MTFIDHMMVTYYGIYSTVIGYKHCGRQIVNYYFLKENLNIWKNFPFLYTLCSYCSVLCKNKLQGTINQELAFSV